MSYIMKKGETGYNIFEKETETLIEIERTEKEVNDLCRKLNLGSGFNGWTPTFFASRVEPVYEEA